MIESREERKGQSLRGEGRREMGRLKKGEEKEQELEGYRGKGELERAR